MEKQKQNRFFYPEQDDDEEIKEEIRLLKIKKAQDKIKSDLSEKFDKDKTELKIRFFILGLFTGVFGLILFFYIRTLIKINFGI